MKQKKTIQERFEQFHEENPNVYDLVVKFSRQMANRRNQCGMKMIWERVRWETAITTNDPEFKLNNNYTAHYARLVMRNEKDLEGFFKTRELRA